ncbi:MAG: hypothetical protein AVDCRST_MAG56-4644, partial [uncultured Cytophagales bacterium]
KTWATTTLPPRWKQCCPASASNGPKKPCGSCWKN